MGEAMQLCNHATVAIYRLLYQLTTYPVAIWLYISTIAIIATASSVWMSATCTVKVTHGYSYS